MPSKRETVHPELAKRVGLTPAPSTLEFMQPISRPWRRSKRWPPATRKVIELRRMFGRPDYQMRVAVADHDAYEAFQAGKLIGLPGSCASCPT
jgi:Lrp/AsnC ligand binding domain